MEDPLTPTCSEQIPVGEPGCALGGTPASAREREEKAIATSAKREDQQRLPAATNVAEGGLSRTQALLKLQSWLSPAFPVGAYSYSHGLEWAVESGSVRDRLTLIDWLDADLRFGTLRNDGIFFRESWRAARQDATEPLVEIAELAAAFRGTSEFALEASQQGSACLATIRKVWPHRKLDAFSRALSAGNVQATLAVCIGSACGAHEIALELALPLYLQGSAANLITAAVRLIPLGQTDGQLALAALEGAVVAASTEILNATLDDLGSAAFMVDLASMAHEIQYTRLFRS
jgi:urease accessory protein